MRARLTMLVAGIATLTLLAFSIPLAIMLRNAAAERAVSLAQQEAHLVTAIVPRTWQPSVPQTRVLFTQAVLTRPATTRVALQVPVGDLAATLRDLDRAPLQLEHVYDY